MFRQGTHHFSHHSANIYIHCLTRSLPYNLNVRTDNKHPLHKLLQSLIRDLLRAIQVQLHLFTPQELLDILEAALLLSQPSNLWLQAWEAAVQPHLKQLQPQQLMQAAEGILGCGHQPSKPWAGVWFVALQVGGCKWSLRAAWLPSHFGMRLSVPSVWSWRMADAMFGNL